MANVFEKLEAYSHQENIQEQYWDPNWIIKRLQTGKDLFNETDTIFIRNPFMKDIPQHVQAHPDKYRYLTMRSKLQNAGFTDIDPPKEESKV